jgi:anthranilate/para-aminobenzoate synthase component II
MAHKTHKKRKKETGDATRAGVKKEMAKPRMARSARITELNLDTARTREQPSTTMPGTVDKVIPSPGPSQPEEAQIAVDKADRPHRDFRIENTLTDEHGDEVKLKKGAHVEVTVTAEPKRR